jgi:EmrB/QacA subfamily drug resistance transporter
MTVADRRHPQRWLIMGVLCLALLVVVLDNTILNVAVPTLATKLSASTSDIQWMINAYVLTLAGLLVAAGSLADRFGRKRSVLFGIAVFGLGSLAAAYSTSSGMLIGARAFMGIGAACMMPGTLAVVMQVFDEDERPRAIGIWTAVLSVGVAIGPVIGGFLLQHFWWGSVFLVNVPVAVLAFVAVLLSVPESRDPNAGRVDVLGAVLSTVGVVAVVYGVISIPSYGWVSGVVLGAVGFGVAALGAFVWWELRTTSPMLDMALFRNRMFSGAVGGMILGQFGIAGSMFLLTQYLQFVMHYGPMEAGLRVAPLPASMLIVSTWFNAPLIKRLGTPKALALGMGVGSVGLAVVALTSGVGYLPLLVGIVLLGAGFGLAGPAAAGALLGAIPVERAGTASGVSGMLTEIGDGMGIAVLGSALAGWFAAGLPTGLGPDAARSLPSALAAVQTHPELAGAVENAFASALSVSQLFGAVAVLAGGAVSGFLLWRAAKADKAKDPIPAG